MQKRTCLSVAGTTQMSIGHALPMHIEARRMYARMVGLQAAHKFGLGHSLSPPSTRQVVHPL